MTICVGADKSSAWVFPAYQLMLRASSPVFSAMLSGGYEETKKEEIVITDIPPHIFYKVLLYINKGELKLDGISEAFAVYTAADKYQMDDLKLACAVELEECSINWDIFWDLLSNCFESPASIVPFQLKLKIMVFLDENATAVFTDSKFLFLSRELVKMIISRNSLQNVSELVICETFISWAKMQCFKTKVEATVENQRIILGDAFYKMKLTLINKKQLLASPVYKILTEQERADIWQENTISPFLSALSTLPRCGDELKQPGEKESLCSSGPIYFVFAKDAYVHQFKVTLYTTVTKVVLSALNEGGEDTLITYGQHCDGEIKSFYAAAFVCYKLSFVATTGKHAMAGFYGSLGYENGADKAVFFSANDCRVTDISKFASLDYWKNTFLNQTFVPEGTNTHISYIRATFC